MKFTHPSGKEITVEPVYSNTRAYGVQWFINSPEGNTWQRTHGRCCGVFRRMMKRKGWTEVPL